MLLFMILMVMKVIFPLMSLLIYDLFDQSMHIFLI